MIGEAWQALRPHTNHTRFLAGPHTLLSAADQGASAFAAVLLRRVRLFACVEEFALEELFSELLADGLRCWVGPVDETAETSSIRRGCVSASPRRSRARACVRSPSTSCAIPSARKWPQPVRRCAPSRSGWDTPTRRPPRSTATTLPTPPTALSSLSEPSAHPRPRTRRQSNPIGKKRSHEDDRAAVSFAFLGYTSQ